MRIVDYRVANSILIASITFVPVVATVLSFVRYTFTLTSTVTEGHFNRLHIF